MSYKNIIIKKEENIAIMYLNRPEAMNALNAEMLKEIITAIDEISEDNDIKALVITGSGDKAFAAGADIKYMQSLNAVDGRTLAQLGQSAFMAVENLEKPVIAAVNGFALGGGCELAMACDIRLASENARFGQPEVKLGITPGFAGTQRLPRLVGEGIAKEMIFTGEMIDVKKAYRIGLINDFYPLEQLLDEAKKLAKKIAANAPVAVKLSKVAINKGMQTDINTAMTIEADLFGMCFSTDDQKTGMTAFLNKEKPVFTGR